MVRKTRVVTWLQDDMTGEELPEGAGQTVTYGLDGRTYEIDLSDDNAHQIRQLLAPLIAKSRMIDGPKHKAKAVDGQKKELSPAQIRQRELARARQIELAQQRRAIAAGEISPEDGEITEYAKMMAHREFLTEIRMWANDNGLDQAMNGRLRPAVRAAWNEAHPDRPAPEPRVYPQTAQQPSESA